MINSKKLSPEDIRKGQEKSRKRFMQGLKNWGFQQMTFGRCLMECSISKVIASLLLVSCGY